MSRYDTRTTVFSPEGRLYQVEYAMEAISQAGSAVGIKAPDGVILAAERRNTSKLLDIRKPTEKMYKIDDHICCCVAGITADANHLIGIAREQAQWYRLQYGEPIPVEQLLHKICDIKQAYTQYGGLRPFGVSFLFAGWDVHFGFQLFQSDPSGNYGGWKAKGIGANNQNAQSTLKSDYEEDMKFDDALKLGVKVLSKTIDTSSPTVDTLEFSTLTLKNGKVKYHIFTKAELKKLLKDSEKMLKEAAEDAEGDM